MGNDGYLINKPIKDYGRIPDNMGLLTQFKQSIDTPMTLVMIPSTGYICSDKLPLVHDITISATIPTRSAFVFSTCATPSSAPIAAVRSFITTPTTTGRRRQHI